MLDRMHFHRHITRRDFLNGVLVGVGGTLLGCKPSPQRQADSSAQPTAAPGDDWYGYGGVGDYRLSHGNTPEVVDTAHRLRDGQISASFDRVASVEDFDLAIVGAGIAGLGAAFEFLKQTSGKSCLVLDNHPIFGGESKENEFDVSGVRLIGPQGANGFFIPAAVTDIESASGDPRWYAELGVPREFRLAEWPSAQKPLGFSPDNYEYLVPSIEHHTSIGYHSGGSWAHDIWRRRLADTPFSEGTRQALLRWHSTGATRQFASEDEAIRALDVMSYQDFVANELKLGMEPSRYVDLFLASALGLGSDAVSAYCAYKLPMPGLMDPLPQDLRRSSFPGGNSGFARYFIKRLIPDAIAGTDAFEDIITGRINFAALDRPQQPVRMRLNATVVSVAHEGSATSSPHANVMYMQNGRMHGVRAKAVIMATGGWINRHVVRDLPAEHRAAYAEFIHAPYLVANVALTNWRFLHKLGATAAIWDKDKDGFGYTCNIRIPMHVGAYQPPLDPDKPTILTFYTPFHQPGLPLREQASLGRIELFTTSYAEYERRIYAQMNKLFASSGFNAEKDVAGVILNRWGHAFSVPFPGFFGGRTGRGPRDVIRKHYGRIAFGHSELNGWQHWGNAADEGRRAFSQLAAAL